MKKIIFTLTTFFVPFAMSMEQSITPHFQIEEFTHIAIATDLEPDDVLALKLIFDEATRIYVQNKLEKYPIDLILVGEGNSAIKRMRMEKMLGEFLNIPPGIAVEVVEGKSTADNIFTRDGEELFRPDLLPSYQENSGEAAAQALKEFVERAPHPLIIQLKPAQELFTLSLDGHLAKKTSVLFYGSFNFRKTIKDVLSHPRFDTSRENTLQANMQTLINQFSNEFYQVGIIESYGVLGDQSAVFHEYPWTEEIATKIEISNTPFFALLRSLIHNWNSYLFTGQLEEMKQTVLSIKMKIKNEQLYQKLETLSINLEALTSKWDPALFEEMQEIITHLVKNSNDTPLKNLESSMQFAAKVSPNAGIEFTLSDVIVALATADPAQFFTARQVQIQVNQNGYLEGIDDASSNVFYYNRVDRNAFAQILIPRLE